MAAKFLNTIGKLGIGVAIAGGVINSALYNGKFLHKLWLRHLQQGRIEVVLAPIK